MKRHYHRCLVEVADALQFAGRSVSTHPCGALVFADQAEEHALEAHGLRAPVGDAVKDEGGAYGQGCGLGSRRCDCGRPKAPECLVCQECKGLEGAPGGVGRRGRKRKWATRTEMLQANREAAKEAGLCGACHARAPKPGRVTCAECLESVAAFKRLRRQRRDVSFADAVAAVRENRRMA